MANEKKDTPAPADKAKEAGKANPTSSELSDDQLDKVSGGGAFDAGIVDAVNKFRQSMPQVIATITKGTTK